MSNLVLAMKKCSCMYPWPIICYAYGSQQSNVQSPAVLLRKSSVQTLTAAVAAQKAAIGQLLQQQLRSSLLVVPLGTDAGLSIEIFSSKISPHMIRECAPHMDLVVCAAHIDLVAFVGIFSKATGEVATHGHFLIGKRTGAP